jgi:maltooligosyltrehalose trehalohydrolase
MTQRYHLMPFGAEVLGNGTVRFRLWAPSAKDVQIKLQHQNKTEIHRLTAQAKGWFEGVFSASGETMYSYIIDGRRDVPDPASRFQPDDVHGASAVVNPQAWVWSDGDWYGRPWHEAVIYELHVGTFTPEGSFDAAMAKLPYLRDLGITAVELMPVADFPGRWDWGYNGVLPFAPDARYGEPDDLKRFVQAAHALGMMVFLDVVYNHFGPEGNYLHLYAPEFFSKKHGTPWGMGFNFDGPHSEAVREFFIHNALYWLEEYHFDGLRFDAVQAIVDSSDLHFLGELAETLRQGPGRTRHLHLMVENGANTAHYLRRTPQQGAIWFDAQWNDDFCNVIEVLLGGEQGGFFAEYTQNPIENLGRSLAEGFVYQGELLRHQEGVRRGEPTDRLVPLAFVNFLENHDRVGNRPYANRLHQRVSPEALTLVTELLLLMPTVPMMFMGQEFAAPQPFPFFCDLEPLFAADTYRGRRREVAYINGIETALNETQVPDPTKPTTHACALLDWAVLQQPAHAAWLEFHRALLALRTCELVPLLAAMPAGKGRYTLLGGQGLDVVWTLDGGVRWRIQLNMGNEPIACKPVSAWVYASDRAHNDVPQGRLPPWSLVCTRE